MNENDRYLPGQPRNKLVKAVRRHLAGYGVRPGGGVCVELGKCWVNCWRWASKVAHSYLWTHWPLPAEIVAQYMLLVLVEMKNHHALRLPFRALAQVPEDLAGLLGSPEQLIQSMNRETQLQLPPPPAASPPATDCLEVIQLASPPPERPDPRTLFERIE
jgi:hypothetical protein